MNADEQVNSQLGFWTRVGFYTGLVVTPILYWQGSEWVDNARLVVGVVLSVPGGLIMALFTRLWAEGFLRVKERVLIAGLGGLSVGILLAFFVLPPRPEPPLSTLWFPPDPQQQVMKWFGESLLACTVCADLAMGSVFLWDRYKGSGVPSDNAGSTADEVDDEPTP